MKAEQEKVLALLKRERDKLSLSVAKLTVAGRSLRNDGTRAALRLSQRHRERLNAAERLEREFTIALDLIRTRYASLENAGRRRGRS